MKPKVSTLRHYRRKKFFYRLFLRRSPRSAGLFGLLWMILWFSLIATIAFLVGSEISALKASIGVRVTCFSLLLFVVLLQWVYGMIVLGYAYAGMVRSCSRVEWLQEAGGLPALFHPLGGLVMVPVLLRQRRLLFALSGVASLICGGLVWTVRYGWLPFELGGYAMWILTLAGIACLCVAIAGFRDRRQFKPYFVLPLALLVFYVCGVRAYHASLARELARERAELSRMLGRSIELRDYWRRQQEGLPLDSEPLKSLSSTLSKASRLPVDSRRFAEEVNEKYPAFAAAVWALAETPPRSVRHIDSGETLASIEMPELPAFRAAARYLSGELMLRAGDRAEVLRCNAGLERIRDWALAGSSLIAKLVAGGIEKMRLEALTVPLVKGTLTGEELTRMIEIHPSWNAAFADALGDEATIFQSIYDLFVNALFYRRLQSGSPEFSSGCFSEIVQRNMPLEMVIHFQRDYRFALRQFQKMIFLLNSSGLSAEECSQQSKPNFEETMGHFYILSEMLLPALSVVCIKSAEMEDYYRMLQIAVAVEQYRRRTGTLPETLDFLPEKPLDSVHRLPILYESGTLQKLNDEQNRETFYGFRLYTRDRDGKDPGGIKARNILTVVLP